MTKDELDCAVRIAGVSDDIDRVRSCEADAQTAFGQYAAAARSQPCYFDVTNRDVNKGAVVDCISSALRVPVSEIAAIGDQPNDGLMFKRSGLSIAMGNAFDQAKSQAVVTTGSCSNGAFAKAVERFVLGLFD